MNCDEARNLLTIKVFGTLTSEQYENLQNHCRTCTACAGRLKKTELLHEDEDPNAEIPLPDWDRSWEVIAGKSLAPNRIRRPGFLPARALAAAALVSVFVLGYFAGRSLFFSDSRSWMKGETAGISASELSLVGFVDDLEPLLINILNRNGGDIEAPGAFKDLEIRIIQDMLVRARFLKRLSAGSENSEVQELIQDMELILTALTNMKPDDTASAGHLLRLLRDKDLAFRLRQLTTAAVTL